MNKEENKERKWCTYWCRKCWVVLFPQTSGPEDCLF